MKRDSKFAPENYQMGSIRVESGSIRVESGSIIDLIRVDFDLESGSISTRIGVEIDPNRVDFDRFGSNRARPDFTTEKHGQKCAGIFWISPY